MLFFPIEIISQHEGRYRSHRQNDELILIEQFRRPVQARVIEL